MENAWQEPPEYRETGGYQLSLPPMQPVTKWLLIANLAIWLPMVVLYHAAPSVGVPLYRLLALEPELWAGWAPLVPVWQLVTYGFMHSPDSPMHLFGNLLWLYFFGTFLEGLIGSRSFVAHYVIALLLGAGVQLGLGLAAGDMRPTVGASGAVMAVVIAMALLRPHMRVIFLFVPVPLWALAAVKVFLDVFGALTGQGAVAHGVHLTGAVWALVAVRSGLIWRDPVAWLEARRKVTERRKEATDSERLDVLLARISKEGIGSLTHRERAFLKRMSKRG
jgi:membrane associated rhomboid family serine protease